MTNFISEAQDDAQMILRINIDYFRDLDDTHSFMLTLFRRHNVGKTGVFLSNAKFCVFKRREEILKTVIDLGGLLSCSPMANNDKPEVAFRLLSGSWDCTQ